MKLRSGSEFVVRSAQTEAEVQVEIEDLATWQGPTWPRYPLGVLHIMRSQGVEIPGLEIEISSAVPQGAGLSSSAALECATAITINELLDLQFSALELAKMAQQAENHYVGMPCGLMDQAASMLAQANHILEFDCLTLEYQQLPFDLEVNGLEILLIDSRVKHKLVDGGYASRFAACEIARTTLGLDSLRHLTPELFAKSDLPPLVHKRVSHVVTEMQRVAAATAALKESKFTEVGELMNQSHSSLRDIYEVSAPELDLICAAALVAGALGARMMGGGFGGSAIILSPINLREHIIENVTSASARSGYRTPRSFIATPSDGARIESA